MSVTGVQGEERNDFSREESREIRRRSQRLLLTLLRPIRRRVVITAVLVIVTQLVSVSGPLLIGFGINAGLTALRRQSDVAPVVAIAGTYIVAAIVGAALMQQYQIQAAKLSQAVLIDLRKRVFLHSQRLSLEFHEKYTSGRIIARQTSDLDAIRELLDSGLNGLIRGVLYIAFTAVALAIADWRSALIIAVAAIPLAFLLRWFQQRSQVAFRRTRTASAAVIVKFVETMTGIRAVKAFRAEGRNERDFGVLVEEYRDANARTIRLFGTLEPGLVLIANVTVAVVLLVGGLRVATDAMTVGILLTVVLYTRQIFSPLQDMSTFYNSYQSASAALEKISGVLEERPSVPDPARPVDLWHARGSVLFDRVRFAYKGGADVLPSFTLDIPAGQTVALVGSTGAGKSTLAKLISRFYDPSEGAVKLDGVDLRQLHPKDLRRAIVMVTQEAYLFSGSVSDNIALGKPDATFEEIRAAAQAVGAHEFIMGMPDGYDTDVNKRGGRVSAGQRQLVSFARAFLADPAVLILDEATASLDIPSERLVQDALQRLLADRTAVIIAHRLSTVAIADRVLVMEHGEIIEDGTPADLIGGTGRFAQLHQAWRDSLV